MRVIAGTAKGHHLKGPDRATTRPATDLVRGAIFAMLEGLANDWSLVLDMYSGTGAMGIEALSRGAGWADFVDRQRRCCDIIKANLVSTKLSDRARVYGIEAEKAINLLDKEYDIIIMDPPYRNSAIGDIITKVANSKLVGTDTIVVVTHSIHLTLEESYPPLKLIKERRHGDSCIAIYHKVIAEQGIPEKEVSS
jgi:16S rRNA (guanine966-N2)-methyltransferase